MGFHKTVALITGGASGIGAALGEALAERGAHVVLADRQLERARERAESIREGGRGASAAELDVRDADAFAALARDVRAEHGQLDYLFNNAGIGIGGPAERYDVADWDDVLDVNVRGVAYGVQAAYPIMRAQGRGHIINTASMAGLLPAGNAASYLASKHAVVGLSKALRIEAARHGVRVSALCPGAIRTPILTGGEYGRHAGPKPSEAKMLELWEKLRPMDPAVFAREVLKDVAKNEPYIIVPRWWKAAWLLERVSPKLSLAVWSRIYEHSYDQLAMGDDAPSVESRDAAARA